MMSVISEHGIVVRIFSLSYLREKHSSPSVTLPCEISAECFDISTKHISGNCKMQYYVFNSHIFISIPLI